MISIPKRYAEYINLSEANKINNLISPEEYSAFNWLADLVIEKNKEQWEEDHSLSIGDMYYQIKELADESKLPICIKLRSTSILNPRLSFRLYIEGLDERIAIYIKR